MFPCIRPGTVKEHVADLVTVYSLAIVGFEQIAPIAVTVAVVDGIQNSSKSTVSVGILFAG